MANELELRIEQKVGYFNWNFDEINSRVDSQIAKYDGLVVTDDQIKEAKETRANLNNFKNEIERRRIEAQKEYCKPYDEFAKQVKIVTEKIARVTNGIDVQIKDFENRGKEAKYNRIKQWWTDNGEPETNIRYELVHDKRYLNKTCKDSDWQKNLSEKALQIKSDMNAISNIPETEKRNYVLAEYTKLLNLSDALGKWEVHAAELRKYEEFSRKAEEKAQEAMKRLDYVQNATKTYEKEPTRENPHTVEISTDSAVYTRIIYVQGTKEQLTGLAEYMNRTGIKFKSAERKG